MQSERLLLPLHIVLREVAGLTLTIGIVDPVHVLAISSHLSLAFVLVAAMTHVLGIMLFSPVSAYETLLLLLKEFKNEWVLIII